MSNLEAACPQEFIVKDEEEVRGKKDQEEEMRDPSARIATCVAGTFCNLCVRSGPIKIGGADGIRTHDLLDAIEARSQLRHGPTELQRN